MALNPASQDGIRNMVQGDLQQIFRIEVETFPNPWPFRALQFELVQNPYCHAFVMDLGGEISGYAFLWIMFEQSHLVNIAFRKADRGRGLGERMLIHLMNYARANGSQEMHLEVRETNEAAIALYRKHEFRVLGRQDRYYQDGTPALFMQADLNSSPVEDREEDAAGPVGSGRPNEAGRRP
ncbi:MAG: ribosomal protein S18-alanine N-acetyltransferase [Acidobacteriota bacterium]|jgi:[ribosomal protein S18]-alanine N-acetyltransferase